MIAKEKLQALSIISAVQGKGVGTALMRRLQPRWVNAIAERISFFERLGYKPFGAPKVGQNGKHATQLMERGELPAENDNAPKPERVERSERSEPEAPPYTLMTDLAEESVEARALAQLQVIDDMLQKAIVNDKPDAVIKLMSEATVLHQRLDRARASAK